jgi:glycosyltransferase involved in cell wall biosynthesis
MDQPAPPRVTVVVPVHNAERYLQQTLDSVLAQTLQDWEVVVVDDASSDASPEIATRYEREHPGRIRLVALAANVGVATARNTAVRSSGGGDLVALLDHDDWLLDHYLERMVGAYDEATAAGGKIGIVACDGLLFNEETGMQERTWSEEFLGGPQARLDYDAMIHRNAILARAVFSRAAFQEVGGFAPECLASDDWDLWLRMIESGYEAVYVPEPLVVWRRHAGSLSERQAFLMQGSIAVTRRALARSYASPRQRRGLRIRLRHLQAVRTRALLRDAVRERRTGAAARLVLPAVARGAVAILQRPSRWAEWARKARRRLPG